ncbi:MAG: hypothetical protein AVDCRST_MAG40-2245, partial [uncultured Gemmatimonadaceae bacterium]
WRWSSPSGSRTKRSSPKRGGLGRPPRSTCSASAAACTSTWRGSPPVTSAASGPLRACRDAASTIQTR